MKQMKTIQFPNDSEPREIVDAQARQDLASHTSNKSNPHGVTAAQIGAAKVASPNNMLHNSNEFTFIPAGHTGELYINYRTASGATDGNISNYHFCNGAGGETTIMANYFKGKFQGADARPIYNNAEVAMLSDVPNKTETWTFTVEDGSTVEKDVYVDDGVGGGSQNPSRICSINNGISVIDAGLTYSRGMVEIRKTGSILWLIDSGVYNFTADFKQTNNRTVLQFDLPKWLSNKMPNVNGVYGGTGTIGYFPALAYENVTYTTFNCQSYLKRSAVGTEADTFQVVYTGLNSVSGGGLCGFHLKMPILLIDAEG